MTQTESLILSNADVDEDEHDLPMISEESVKLVQKRWSLQFADTCKAPAAVPNGDLRKDWISLVALVDDHGDGSTSERVEYVYWDEVPKMALGTSGDEFSKLMRTCECSTLCLEGKISTLAFPKIFCPTSMFRCTGRRCLPICRKCQTMWEGLLFFARP